MSVTISFLLSAALIVADQIIKAWAYNSLAPINSINIIEGLLSFTYVENRGAAFGIFSGQKELLIISSLIVIAVVSYIIITKKVSSRYEVLSLSLILAGGVGNLIDRVFRGFVVDYIDINQLFSWPMFNLADCCVVSGAALLLLCVFLEEHKAKKAKNMEVSNEENSSDSE